ncbi:MAG: tetratricopeptide repeat protein, partial [Chitinophagaceae bacterium]|nr:tetratricopeptide repeat protein [Chitinophagaceae bacterium]
GKNNELRNNTTVDIRLDDAPEQLKDLRRSYTVNIAYQHMNDGDLAVEKNDMVKAMAEYNAAMQLFPNNLEMQFWTAITLANNKEVDKAIPLLKKIFNEDKNWKELARRLPAVNLLTVSEADLKRILSL